MPQMGQHAASEEAAQQATLPPLEKQALDKRLVFGPSPWQSLVSSVGDCSLLILTCNIALIIAPLEIWRSVCKKCNKDTPISDLMRPVLPPLHVPHSNNYN